eukprot:2529714-Amphidinium_carterae.3
MGVQDKSSQASPTMLPALYFNFFDSLNLCGIGAWGLCSGLAVGSSGSKATHGIFPPKVFKPALLSAKFGCKKD